MTLQEWSEKSSILYYITPNGVAWTHDLVNSPYRPLLWELSDYKVSTVEGGVIWLVRFEE
jgi:hypothetical protein